MLIASGFGKDPDDIEMFRYVFNKVGYKHIARVETGLNYEMGFYSQVDEFAALFEFDIMSIFHP